MQILQNQHHPLSSSNAICPMSLLPKLSSLSLRRPTTIIRMGGGPRTYPGGVSKWQWKRMQANKAKQLLKARLAREHQIYEMRKRAELKAAIADLERPWEVVHRAAPNSSLFSVAADEQLKVLADRFQKPGGFDLWSQHDGPQLFETPDGLPTARFFPKGVVHSVKPYGQVHEVDGSGETGDVDVDVSSTDRVASMNRRGRRNAIGRNSSRGSHSQAGESDGQNPFDSDVKLESRARVSNGRDTRSGKQRGRLQSSGDADGSVGLRNSRGRRNGMNSRSRAPGGKLGNDSFARATEDSPDEPSRFSGSKSSYGGKTEHDHRRDSNGRVGGYRVHGNGLRGRQTVSSSPNTRNNGRKWSSRGNVGRYNASKSEDVYDMSLQRDGSYGFSDRVEDGIN